MNLENENTMDLVEKYIAGKMDKMESLHFESQMNSNPALLELVTQQSAIHALIIEAGLSDIRGMIKNDISKIKTRTKTKWIAGSALVIIVTMAGLLYWTNKKTEGTDFIQKPNSTTKVNNIAKKNKQPEPISQGSNEFIANQPIVTGSTTKVAMVNDHFADLETEANTPVRDQVALPSIETQKSIDKVGSEDIPVPATLPCDGFHPIYSLIVTSSYVNQGTGKIAINTNETNLKFYLDNSKIALGKTFEGLTPGNYTVSMTNDDGCIWKEENVLVKETNCIPLEKDIFRVTSEAVFSFPFEKQNLKEINLYNKAMQHIKTWKIGDVLEWDGLQNNGQSAGTGIFKIVHTYSNGEVCQVVLTVFE